MPVFYEGLDRDIERELICCLRRLWLNNADSSLKRAKCAENGEEAENPCFFRPMGMTVCRKSFEVRRKLAGFRCCMNSIFDMVQRSQDIQEEDLFDLHKMLMQTGNNENDEPVGAWKTAPNGTYAFDGQRQVYYEYAAPEDVACLMDQWLMLLNETLHTSRSGEEASEVYARLHLALVWIHPFSDGNGRIARLVSNLPVLKAGFPPIVISGKRRKEYISLLSQYKLYEGSPEPNACLLPSNIHLDRFVNFCRSSWETSIGLVRQAHQKQKMRNEERMASQSASLLHENISFQQGSTIRSAVTEFKSMVT